MKRKETKELFQKYYDRFKQFQRREFKRFWREFLTLSENSEGKQAEKPKKRVNRMVSYDIHGNKIEPDNLTKCPGCKSEINNVNMDIITEESTETHIIYECLTCQQRIKVKN
ncbi:MAG: hypothetical protein I3273_06210 [Candidatus Moeniiplasma glomeromycotorum]|nr:hypothetical protein [Candidatus Moeniiplasma glomeromycotorum]MCE8168010.1 hypothetical protein [Candidatus Moeniiplasma glomeromycotorum]MCE8169678.1 hypothetical protein [Candidatus Moeniiplasma glomeromycotorum]